MIKENLIQGQLPGHCGAASLSSVLAWYGKRVSQEYIAEEVGFFVEELGISVHQLMIASLIHGCGASVKKGRDMMSDIDTHLERNMAGIICVDNGDHWVALLGKDKRYYYVMDPNSTKEYHKYTRSRLLKRIGKYYASLLVYAMPPKKHCSEVLGR
jgi:ABC-type bacteriocin/lantibiotic exporter with double-glycine peptidase domain